jgi:predicted transcriptional regulator
VKAQQSRPAIADELERANDELRARLQRLREERDQLKHSVQEFARLVHVLEVENATLKAGEAPADRQLRLLHQPSLS